MIAAQRECDGLLLAADRPGVYRIEGRLGKLPWVFANPVYLRSEAHMEQKGPAQSDRG